MSALRVLIVDDEPIARQVLREELATLPNVEIVGEAANGEAALIEIARTEPNLVFLDIQMPVMDGFEMLDRLSPGALPAFVMVTAFDRHAIQAFERGAVDYLVKPAGLDRIRQAVERAARLVRSPAALADQFTRLQDSRAAVQPAAAQPRKIVGKAGGEYFFLDPRDILAFQAEGELVWIVATQRRYLATQTLKMLEERLGDNPFRRIHRNALVNINRIRKMSMLTSQRWLLTLDNGKEFVVSKRQAKFMRDILHW